MLELAQEVLAGEEAWVVGGAVRDELLGRELVDLDIAVRDPRKAARAFAKRAGGAPFALSERHGAWRVALEDGRTVDFTPLPASIEDDLATRDFTINAIARPLAGGEPVDPFGGRADLEAHLLRAVGESVFRDDPLRLLRAVRLEDELGFGSTRRPSGSSSATRSWSASRRASGSSPSCGGSRPAATAGSTGSGCSRRSAARSTTGSTAGTRPTTASWPSSATGSAASPSRTSCAASPPRCCGPSLPSRTRARSTASAVRPSRGRSRRSPSPAPSELAPAIEEARANDPAEPLLRGDELDLPPGPEIGRLLAEIEEERAAGTIATREEALDYARRHAGSVREDG